MRGENHRCWWPFFRGELGPAVWQERGEAWPCRPCPVGCGASEAPWGEWSFAAWHGHPRVSQGWSCSRLWGSRDKLPGQLRSCPHPAGSPRGPAVPACCGVAVGAGNNPSVLRGHVQRCVAAPRPRVNKHSLVGASGGDAEPGRSVPVCGASTLKWGRRQGRAAPPARPSCLKSQGVPAGAEPAQTPWCRAGGCSALGTPL